MCVAKKVKSVKGGGGDVMEKREELERRLERLMLGSSRATMTAKKSSPSTAANQERNKKRLSDSTD